MDNIDDDLQLIELGPRFIKTSQCSTRRMFRGPEIWENIHYASPNKYIDLHEDGILLQAISRQEKKNKRN